MTKPTEPLTDPREMRKVLQEAARGDARVDGKPLGQWSMPPASSLIRNALHAGHHAGWSGEDTMTVLAYHALRAYESAYESAYDRLLDLANCMPSSTYLMADVGPIEAPAAPGATT